MASAYAGNNPYPYGSGFSLDQYSNPYSLYSGQALPWPSQYGGTPTNALGQPIQSYLQAQAAAQPAPVAPAAGMTLNSSPGARSMPGGIYGAAGGPAAGIQQAQQLLTGQGAYGNANQNQAAGLAALMGLDPSQLNGMGGGGSAPAPAAPQAAAPAFDSRAAALQALANPGHVTTPGANVPYNQGAVSQGPGVLQQFLQNWQAGGAPTKGAGNYNNAAFFNALQKKWGG